MPFSHFQFMDQSIPTPHIINAHKHRQGGPKSECTVPPLIDIPITSEEFLHFMLQHFVKCTLVLIYASLFHQKRQSKKQTNKKTTTALSTYSRQCSTRIFC